jgi:predicted Zn-dependent protease with MMP-like domain/Flp pilus assembly protein TadD
VTEETVISDRWELVQDLLDRGKFEEALAEAENWCGEAPGSAEARALAGIVRVRTGDVEGGLAALDEALELDPGFQPAKLERARVLYEQDRFEEVLDALEDEGSVESRYLVASALFELGEHEEAESVVAAAVALEELPELRYLEALLALERADPEGALGAARRGVELDPELAEGYQALGLAYTQLGRIEEADAAFARAAELAPDSYFRPFRLSAEEFDQILDEALAELPEEFEAHLDNVEVAIEDVPDPALVREGTEFDLLGLYQGRTIQSVDWGLPDRVLLYQRNLENVSPDRETLLEEIRDTLFHEIGHHMGMDEEAVRSAEESDEPDEGDED